MPIIVNDLDNLPHRAGQRVLVAERDDYAVQIIRWNDGYVVVGTVRQPGGSGWSNVSAERRTVQEARELARRVWREGRNFNVVIGPTAEKG
jgi:hypothetical protein